MADMILLVENSIEELVAFSEVIAEISGRTDRPVDEWIDNNLQFIDPDDRKDFKDVLEEFAEVAKKFVDNMEKSKADRTIAPSEGTGAALPRKDIGTILMRFFLDVTYRLGDRAEMISRAFLIAAESSFEVLFGQLMRVIYVKNPSALPKSDYSFTLEELANYASVHDAREALITCPFTGSERDTSACCGG